MRISILVVFLMLAACVKHKPVTELTFAEKKAITEQCKANGQIESDDYCKEVAYVFHNEEAKKRLDETTKKFAEPSKPRQMPF